jgi:hypothetical protein
MTVERPTNAAPPKKSPNWRIDRLEKADEEASVIEAPWVPKVFCPSGIAPRNRKAIGDGTFERYEIVIGNRANLE